MPWKYCEASALPSRHPNRINVFALSHQDISELINKKYFQKKELILGQWIGTVKKYFKINKKEYLSSLEYCPKEIIDTYKLYYKLMMSKNVE